MKRTMILGAALVALAIPHGSARAADVADELRALLRDQCEAASHVIPNLDPALLGARTYRKLVEQSAWECYANFASSTDWIADRTDNALLRRCIADERRRVGDGSIGDLNRGMTRVMTCAKFK